MITAQPNILLADDDQDDCLFFKDAIGGLIPATNFMAVHNGEQLMQVLTNKTNKLPDVLFLDLNMPRKNGFECLSEIKQNKKLSMLPVVVFSTSFEQEVVNRLYNNGAHFFIRKPAEFSLYKKIILHTLRLITQKNFAQPAKESFVLTVENSLII
ncbi:MAG: response regulator [Ferruginibacter sp.]